MIKLFNEENEILTIEEDYIVIDDNSSPIYDLFKNRKRRFNQLFIDDKEINLNEISSLKVNLNKVVSIYFVIDNSLFNKEELLSSIFSLKELEVIDKKTAQDKLNKLLDIINPYKPLMTLFYLDKESFIEEEELISLLKGCSPLIYLKEMEIKESEEIEKKEIIEQEEKKELEKEKKFESISNSLSNNKFHFLLIFVSALLFEIALPLGILNASEDNKLYIFLFICGSIGVFMEFYAYYDYFKTKGFKDLTFFISVICNLLGLGVGVLLFNLFYDISSKSESAPSSSKLLLISVIASISLLVASIGIAYLIKIIKKLIEKKNKAD